MEKRKKWDENIPQELKALDQWVCWGGEKLPKNPYNGKNAKSNDPTTWSDYETAVKAVEKYGLDGIGFMLTDGYFGVDLDNSTEELNHEFVTNLRSYAEYSKSGKGIHVIARGKLPKGRRRKDNIEMYDSGRYFIMTGDKIGDFDIRDATEEIKHLHKKYLDTATEERIKQPKPTAPKKKLEDDEVLEKARSSKNAMLFQILFTGNWENFYPSQSEADMALANLLAFWTGCDMEQMDRLFRRSNLMRDKWDRKQSGTTYGTITLEKAIESTVAVYDPDKEEEVIIDKEGVARPTSSGKYGLHDTGNAQRLVEKFEGLIRYNHENKVWMIWNGKRWKIDNTGEVKRLTDSVVYEMKEEAQRIQDEDLQKKMMRNVQRAFSSSGKEAMIREATHKDGIPCLNDDFDRDKALLNTQDGVLNLKNNELIDHNPDYFMSKITNTGVSNEPPKLWLKFLDEIMEGDQEMIEFIQRAVGYSITGSVTERVIFFCYGTGANGKSVFLNTISELLGSYTTHAQPETIMYKKTAGNVNTDVARLKGARFVTSVEPNEGVRLNEGLIKQLTGGDTVTARHLYGKEFEFKPEFKLWLATNHKPVVRGTDEGIWDRIRLIPFNYRIPEHKRDKAMEKKLRKEFPQILGWAREGVRKWLKHGLDVPEKVTDATKEYRSEMDIINSFIEEKAMRVEGHEEPAGEIYKEYLQWARSNKEYEMSSTKFGREFSRYFDRKRTAQGTVYVGIKLKDHISFGNEEGGHTS